MEISDALKELYGDYYLDERVLIKRRIAARQTLDHLNSILPCKNYRSIIDIGAGDGSLLEELNKINVSGELHAVEISESGWASIQEKKLDKVRSVIQFDGYNISSKDNAYGLGLAIHVLEHVEHERVFIREMARTCEYIYIEVPLELTLSIKKNIVAGSKFGHVNFYNASTFQNLLESSGLEVLVFKQFSPSLEYETFLDGVIKGTVKYIIRKWALKIYPKAASLFITYMGGAYCRRRFSA